MARTFEYVLHFVGCDTVTVSPNQIIIIIIIIIKKFGGITSSNKVGVQQTILLVNSKKSQ